MYKDYEIKLNAILDKHGVQKVELDLIKDALKWVKGVNMFGKNIDIAEDELEKVLRSIKVDTENLQEDYNALQKGIDAVEKGAKDLGINVNSIPKYKEALEAIKYGQKQINKGKKLLK